MNNIEKFCVLVNDEEWTDKLIDWDYVLSNFDNSIIELNKFLEVNSLPRYYKGIKTPPRTVRNIVNSLMKKGLKKDKILYA